MSETHVMRKVSLEKVVVNIGLADQTDRLDKAATLLERLTQQKPTRTQARRGSREFGLRAGQDVGVKVTLREEAAETFLKKALWAVQHKIPDYSFDDQGNLSFGIREHTDFEGERYDPNVGLFGMDIVVVLKRPGRRVNQRRMYPGRIGKSHRMAPEEAMEFLTENFNVEVVEL